MTTKVGMVVLNYRNYSDTIDCLDTLLAVLYAHTEIAVVDNGSQNGSLDFIARHLAERDVACARVYEAGLEEADEAAERIILIQAASNRGYAAGNNLGIRALLARGAKHIVILNNDTVVEPDFLGPLVEYADAHPEVGAVGPMILNAEGGIYWMCARRRPQVGDFFFRLGIGRKLFPHNRWLRRDTYEGEYFFDFPKEVEVLSGSCMLIKGGVLRDIGMLDEHTFLYAEEIILSEQLRVRGLTSVVVPTSRIVHMHARASATMPTAVLRAAFKESVGYYWTHYRHVNRFAVAGLLLVSRTPPNPFRRWARARS